MERFITLGQEEHLTQCQMLIHFADHGTLVFEDAHYLEEWGYLKPKVIQLFPMTKKVLAYELTQKGRKSSKAFRKIWTDIYVPYLKLETDIITDKYLEEDAGQHIWVFRPKRLEAEREAGRLQLVLERAAPLRLDSTA